MRILLLLILLSCTFSVFSQPLDFKIQWGEEFKAPRKSSLDDIVGHDATGIYAIKVRGGMFVLNAYTLERYDKNFRPVKSVDLEINEDGQSARIQHVLHLKNKLLMFYVLRNHTSNMSELYVREINKTTLMPEPNRVKLGEAD